VKRYETGGMEGIGRHRLGSGAKRREVWTREQERREKRYRKGSFQRIGEAVTWCGRELSVEVSYKKLYDWFRRWG
jgi:hypothetical protein